MPDRKDSSSDGTRIEQELVEKEKPFYIHALALFLKGFFVLYDLVVFIPFKILADPEKKRQLSEKLKVCKCILKIDYINNKID